jgi:hypothetical protein
MVIFMSQVQSVLEIVFTNLRPPSLWTIIYLFAVEQNYKHFGGGQLFGQNYSQPHLQYTVYTYCVYIYPISVDEKKVHDCIRTVFHTYLSGIKN